jgi:hypothetical protein
VIFSAYSINPYQYTVDVQHGSSGATFGPTNGIVMNMTADNAVVYMAVKDISSPTTTHSLAALTFSGGVSSVLATGLPEILALAGDSSRLFLLGLHQIDTYVPGGSPPQPFATGLSRPQGLVADGTHVYWTDSMDGAVYRMPVGGGTQVKVASGQPAVVEIAQNSTSVFWTTWSGDRGNAATWTAKIMRLAK